MRLSRVMAALLMAALGCGDTESKSNNANASNSADTNNVNNNQNNLNSANNTAENSFDPGVAPDTPSNTLGDDDRTRICQELGAYTDQLGLTESDCIFTAYGAAEGVGSMNTEELRQACQENFDRCMEQSLGFPAGGNFCSPVANCSGTVAQGIACVIDAAKGQIDATSDLPRCDEITYESLGLISQIQLPPSPPCAHFNATCE